MPEHCHITATSLPIGSKNHCPITADVAPGGRGSTAPTRPTRRNALHAARRRAGRARYRAHLAVTGLLAHVSAACAHPGRRVNARAHGKPAGLFLTAPRSPVTQQRVRIFFPFCHACLHPLVTKRQASPRRVQRSARGLVVPRPSPVTHPLAGQDIDTSESTAILPACHLTNKADKPALPKSADPPGPALPSLPITAIGQHCHSRRQHCGWTNQRDGNNFTHRNTTAVPIGSVLAVIAVLPPSQSFGVSTFYRLLLTLPAFTDLYRL